MKTLIRPICTLFLLFLFSFTTYGQITIINVSTDSSGNVQLTENGNATVEPDSHVQWVCTGPELRSIVIRPVAQEGTDQRNIWQVEPRAQNNDPRVWSGRVMNFDTRESQYYYLDWVKTDGTAGTIDPVISVNP